MYLTIAPIYSAHHACEICGWHFLLAIFKSNIKSYFENNSVLKFTYEEEKNKKIAFLDVF